MMGTAQATLAEFLLARIAEDEAVLNSREAIPHSTHLMDAVGTFGPHCPTCRGGLWGGRSRALAECEAKRRIVAEHPHLFEEGDGRLVGDRWSCQTCHNGYTDWWCLTLRLLALPYVDHPDYRSEWKP